MGVVRPKDQEKITIDNLLLTVPKVVGHMGKHQGLPGGRRGEVEAWAGAFIVASVGKARKGGVSRHKIGCFE